MSGIAARPDFSLADTLDCVLPFAPASLVPERTRGRLGKVAAGLPPIARGLLECRLPDPGQVDLSLGVLDCGREKTMLRERFRALDDGSSAWARVRAFAEHWLVAAVDADRGRYAWFEFDVDDTVRDCPAPSVFLSVGELGAAHGWEEELAILSPDAPAAAAAWLARLCSGARVEFFGIMVPRANDRVRLNLTFRASGLAWDWLAAHGARPDPDLRPIFDGLFRAGAPVITVDALPGGQSGALAPRIGLECRPTDAADARAIFEICRAQDLCDARALDDALAWTGATSALDGAAAYPAHLVLAELTGPGGGPGALLREINHVKITFGASGLEAAKIYLSFTHAQPNGRRNRSDLP